jgi:hypothetical protein
MDANRPSRAKAFFHSIKSSEDGASFLKALVGSEAPTFETEFLDFKGGHGLMADNGKLEELKKLWAKSLSCFANSEGGVLVFGVDAPQGAARSLSPVQDIGELHKKLRGWLPALTEPPVQGVEIDVYPDAPGSAGGFVVCLIPASPWRPHQIRVGGQPGQFYVRAADNCIPCNQSTLRALFAPSSWRIWSFTTPCPSRV